MAFAALKTFEVESPSDKLDFGKGNIKIIPDLIVSGSSGSDGTLSGLMGLQLMQMLQEKKKNPES